MLIIRPRIKGRGDEERRFSNELFVGLRYLILVILWLEPSQELGYVLYSALGSFYIPSCIMVFVYIRIYYAAKRRARRGIKNFRKSQTNEQVTSFTSNSVYRNNNVTSSQAGISPDQQISTIETANQTDPTLSIPNITCDLASDPSQNETTGNGTDIDNQYDSNQQSLQVNPVSVTQLHAIPELGCSLNGSKLKDFQISPTYGRCRALSVGIDSDMISEFEPSSSDSGVARKCSVVKPRKFRIYKSIFNKPIPNEIQSQITDLAELEPALPRPQRPRDPEKEKRRVARQKEKRATLILGLIMGSFIACWLPFFFLYILIPICKCDLDQSFKIAFWLGYMNSALNPAIYTIFNKDFRRAFRRILFK